MRCNLTYSTYCSSYCGTCYYCSCYWCCNNTSNNNCSCNSHCGYSCNCVFMVRNKLSNTICCTFNSLPDIFQARPHTIQIHQIHWSVPAVIVMIHCVRYCNMSFYEIFTDKSSNSGIISSCLCKIQPSCTIHLIPRKTKVL